jgi:hypothetical protein
VDYSDVPYYSSKNSDHRAFSIIAMLGSRAEKTVKGVLNFGRIGTFEQVVYMFNKVYFLAHYV